MKSVKFQLRFANWGKGFGNAMTLHYTNSTEAKLIHNKLNAIPQSAVWEVSVYATLRPSEDK